MSEVEKMNEAMYERLGEIAKFASNKRVELDPDFKGGRPDDAQNRLMLAAFTELRQMCEFYKPGEPQNANLRQSDESTRMPQEPIREDSPNSPDSRSEAKLTPEEQSALQREEARQKRVIHWKTYETKVDVAVMGKTEQNGKVYEVRISKRHVAKIDDTYAQCKVNGKGVLTCNFTGSAWMLKRILTAGMQALVNYKAKRARDRRRNNAKRKAAAKGQQAHDNKGAAATHS